VAPSPALHHNVRPAYFLAPVHILPRFPWSVHRPGSPISPEQPPPGCQSPNSVPFGRNRSMPVCRCRRCTCMYLPLYLLLIILQGSTYIITLVALQFADAAAN